MHSYASVEGGKKILIFTERISRHDIEVHLTLDNGKQIMKMALLAPTSL